MTTPDPTRAALLRIFDLAEDRPDIRAVVTAAFSAQPNPPLDVKAVGTVIDEHYRARLAADPTGPRLHECGSYCGADLAARLAALAEPKP